MKLQASATGANVSLGGRPRVERPPASTAPSSRPSGLLTIAAVLACLLSVLSPREAAAYCRSTTCRSATAPATPEDACRTAERNGLCEGGSSYALPLWWGTGCVEYTLDSASSARVPYDASLSAAKGAFAAWTKHRCAGLPVDVDVHEVEPTANATVEYRLGGANKNVIVFRDGIWPHSAPLAGDGDALTTRSGELALTTVTFSTSTGEIFDADIEINSAEYDIRPNEGADPQSGTYDLQTVLTHESGHFLGLGHSTSRESVMYARGVAADALVRTLAPDDQLALCAAYPPRDGSSTSKKSLGAEARSGGSCAPPTPEAKAAAEAAAAAAYKANAIRLSCEVGPAPGRESLGASGSALMFGVVLGAMLVARRKES